MRLGIYVLALFLFMGASGTALSQPEGNEPSLAILKVEELKPGMKGYGLTVFKGSEVEKFDVEILGVMHGFYPKRARILARLSGGISTIATSSRA